MAHRKAVSLTRLFLSANSSRQCQVGYINFKEFSSVTSSNFFEKKVPEAEAGGDGKISSSLTAKKKAKVIKKLYRENKELYGELQESKREKVKRIKAEAKMQTGIKGKEIPIRTEKENKGIWLTFEEEEGKYLKENSSMILKRKKRNPYEPPILPKAHAVHLEHASASIKKGQMRSILAENEDKDQDQSRDEEENASVDKKEISQGRRAHKNAEIEWALKNAPTMVKLIELSPLSSQKMKIEKNYDRNDEVAADNNEGSKSMKRSKTKFSEQNVADVTGSRKSESSIVNSDKFSLPFYKIKSNPDKEEITELHMNKNGNKTLITSYPYPFSRTKMQPEPNSESSLSPSQSKDLEINIEAQPSQSSGDSNPIVVASTTQRLPSVSKILSATMPEEQALALKRWEEKMIAQMGAEGFRQYKESILRNGKLLHGNIESYLRGTPLDDITVAEPNQGHWKSLGGILSSVEGVSVLESHVVHPELEYCGVIDCVAEFRNRLVLIDWKTSQKPKPFVSMTYDTPLQIAAYIGAINYDPRYSMRINEGLIVVAYQDGKTCQTFLLGAKEISKYWKMWLERLKLFRSINPSSNL